MDKAHALALANALEAQGMPFDVGFRLDAAGVELWTVSLDTSHVYNGADLIALGNYCAGHGLTITATFSALGVV